MDMKLMKYFQEISGENKNRSISTLRFVTFFFSLKLLIIFIRRILNTNFDFMKLQSV